MIGNGICGITGRSKTILIACPCLASIAPHEPKSWRHRSITLPADSLRKCDLLPVRRMILRQKPRFESLLDQRPFLVENGVCNSVDVVPFVRVSLRMKGLVCEAQAQCCLLRGLVVVTAFPFDASVAERERLFEDEVSGFRS